MESFAASSLQTLAALTAAVQAADTAALAGAAHRLKGEASTLGASAAAATCGALESLPSPLDVAAARNLLSRLEMEMDLMRRTLQAELDAAGAV